MLVVTGQVVVWIIVVLEYNVNHKLSQLVLDLTNVLVNVTGTVTGVELIVMTVEVTGQVVVVILGMLPSVESLQGAEAGILT